MGVSSNDPHGPSPPMQSSSADKVPSLSATCPTTTALSSEKAALDGYHDTPKATPKATPKSSDVRTRATKKPAMARSIGSAMQAAKREISEKIRDDWTWPSTQSNTKELLDVPRKKIERRERESDSEYPPTSPVSNADPYRFDTPDSIAQPVLSKKRKRRLLLEDELQWNNGLKTYSERRDAWTGAILRPPSPPNGYLDVPHINPGESSQLSTSTSPGLSTRSTSPPSFPTVLLPVASPILPPNNPIRSAIKPPTYPAIYEKIVVRGLSPTIPINLKDVTLALVAGWKKDGEWPPKTDAEKAGLVNGATGGARGEGKRLARRGVGRVKRVLGLGRGIDDPGRGEG